jgi:hypothetical protein
MINQVLKHNGSQIKTVKDMKEQILEISDKLKNNEITSEEAQNLLLVLFGVIKRSIKLTKEQEERIDKFWDRNVVNGLMTSNAPKYIIEHELKSILLIDNEQTFLDKSKEFGLLKNVL